MFILLYLAVFYDISISPIRHEELFQFPEHPVFQLSNKARNCSWASFHVRFVLFLFGD